MTWLDELVARGPAEVGIALGLEHGKRSGSSYLEPCPACSAKKRHPTRGDRRGAVGLRRDGMGWRCHECGAGGDAVTLAMYIATGRTLGRGDREWTDVRRVCAAAGLCALDPRNSSPVSAARRPPAQPRPTPSPPRRAPEGEVLELWDACRLVTDDLEAVRWTRSRALDPGAIEDNDLARVIDPSAPRPAWARFRGRPWSETHRLVVPLYGPSGRLESLHARALDTAEPKSVSPAGYEVRGLVMVNALAKMVLAGDGSHCTIWIGEGIPDYLTLATEWSDADEDAPAAMGIISGSWTAEIAARIPDGAVLVVATDPDRAGEKYLQTIVETLAERMRAGAVRVRRWRSRAAQESTT